MDKRFDLNKLKGSQTYTKESSSQPKHRAVQVTNFPLESAAEGMQKLYVKSGKFSFVLIYRNDIWF